MTPALQGSFPPLVTPFRDGAVDVATFGDLVRRQVTAGSAGVVVTGTSGEPSVLTTAERTTLYEQAVTAAARRLSVVAATGGQSLDETLALTAAAERAGVDAVLVVTPYYVMPPQRGLVEYFVTVAGSTSLPVLIYHIPGRAAVSITVDSVMSIVDRAPNVVGLKHAANDLGYVTQLLQRRPGFRVFCGLEELSFPMLALGGAGLMNAVGNVAPRALVRLCEAVDAGKLAEARELHYALFDLNKSVFWDTNPIPIKYLMSRLGLLPGNEHRSPMTGPDESVRTRLDAMADRVRTEFPEVDG